MRWWENGLLQRISDSEQRYWFRGWLASLFCKCLKTISIGLCTWESVILNVESLLSLSSLCFCLYLFGTTRTTLQAMQWTVIMPLSWFAPWSTQTHIWFFNVGNQNIFELILNPPFKYSSFHLPSLLSLVFPTVAFCSLSQPENSQGKILKKFLSSLKNEGCYYCVKPTTWKTLVRIKLIRFLL